MSCTINRDLLRKKMDSMGFSNKSFAEESGLEISEIDGLFAVDANPDCDVMAKVFTVLGLTAKEGADIFFS